MDFTLVMGYSSKPRIATGLCCAGGIQLCMAIYHWREYLRGDHRVDATDVFQKVGYQKKLRLGKLVFYLVFFILMIYKCGPYPSPSPPRSSSASKILNPFLCNSAARVVI
jgi:hypothetical protein